jgi:hypothetical protein
MMAQLAGAHLARSPPPPTPDGPWDLTYGLMMTCAAAGLQATPVVTPVALWVCLKFHDMKCCVIVALLTSEKRLASSDERCVVLECQCLVAVANFLLLHISNTVLP